MRTTQRLLTAISLTVLVGSAYGQTPADGKAAPKIEKSCDGGQDAKVKQECLKVAKQMEHDAATGTHPPSSYADSRNPSASNTVMHSSPVMDTPEEVKEEKQARKEAEADSAKAKAKAKADQRSPDTKPSSDSPQPKPDSDK
jgi:hypothetical protein